MILKHLADIKYINSKWSIQILCGIPLNSVKKSEIPICPAAGAANLLPILQIVNCHRL